VIQGAAIWRFWGEVGDLSGCKLRVDRSPARTVSVAACARACQKVARKVRLGSPAAKGSRDHKI